jgi:hypothetical protein
VYLITKIAICWSLNNKPKEMFILVKGDLQGITKSSKLHSNSSRIPINKSSFFNSFKNIHNKIANKSEIESYNQAKDLSTNYNQACEVFYDLYKDWLRIDRNKYYQFKQI